MNHWPSPHFCIRVFTLRILMLGMLVWPLFAFEDNGYIPRPVVFLKALGANHFMVRELLTGRVYQLKLAGCRESKSKQLKWDIERGQWPAPLLDKIDLYARAGGPWSIEFALWGKRTGALVCAPHFSLPRWQKQMMKFTVKKSKKVFLHLRR